MHATSGLAQKTLGIIGIGNMGEALLCGVLRRQLLPPCQVIVSDPSDARRADVRSRLGVMIADDNREVVTRAQVVLLAVKPQQLSEVLLGVADLFTQNHLLISVAAGATTAFLESLLPAPCPVVRSMPNTPALIGEGASAYCRGRFAGAAHAEIAHQILQAAGFAVEVDEQLIDPITAVSGSGPAYVFYLIEKMIEGAVQLGLSAELARNLVLQTVAGAGRLAQESTDEPAALRAKVTSKGGTTAAALAVLEARDFGPAMHEAMRAAMERAHALSK